MMLISDAENKLREATTRFNQADQKYRTASSERTAALNAVNDAQKAFDKALGDLRGSAPVDTDWGQPASRCSG